MKKFLANKKGVTILEGLIALTLLALVATGTFAVLLSISRKSSQPDVYEEMALAVERAAQKLQVYVYPDTVSLDAIEGIHDDVKEGLCGNQNTDNILAEDTTHDISCLLPPICDGANSSFTYTVDSVDMALPGNDMGVREVDQIQAKDEYGDDAGADLSGRAARRIKFNIVCNGFTL